MCKEAIKQKSYSSARLITSFGRVTLTELGFSLVELLFILALISILSTLAFPVYRHVVMELRLLLLAERISTAVNYARSEAIKRQNIVTLCKSNNGKSCVGKWKNGWIIFIDKKAMGLSEKATVLRIYPPLDKTEFLEWRGARSHDYLRLSPDGSTHGQNGSFIICVRAFSKKIVWLIKLSQTGRLRIDKKPTNYLDCNG